MSDRTAVAAALLLLLAAGVRAADLEEAARAAVARRDFAAARTIYERLAEAHPENLDYLVWDARLASWLGAYDDADRLYDRVLARDPTHLDALVGKAYVASWTRRFDEAELLLDRADAAWPGNLEVAEVRRRNAEARTWRRLPIVPAPVILTAGVQYEDYSYTDAAYMAFARGEYRPGVFRVFLEAQEWDKFEERSTRVGTGVSGKLAPRWPFAVEAWIDPGSDVFPEYDLRAGIGRVLPWRFGVGLDYRYAQFSEDRFQVVSGTLEYYLPFPAWMTATYYHSITTSDTPGLSGNNDAYAIRYHHEVIPPVRVHVGYAHGGETFADLSVDEIGQFEADTVEALLDVALTWHWVAHVGGAYQSRDNGDTVITMGAGLSYYWR